ncbi:hypothetical protein ScPMuIL_017867 [Solemya velum]
MAFSQKLSYSVGHVLNDLTASMWFSYLIIFFHQVKDFDNKLAGNLMLIGQVSDALFTPFVGIESDRTKGMCRMGKRKSWHFIGTVAVLCSFPFLFINCITCGNAPDMAQFIYYAPFVVIFQFGWASTQISHLSLIPDIATDEHERVELNGMRYACTVLSNLVVYGIAWLLLDLNSDESSKSEKTIVSSVLDSTDLPKFRNLTFIVMGIGFVFVMIFHLGVRENKNSRNNSQLGRDALIEANSAECSLLNKVHMNWRDWLKEHQFYQVALLYMCTRLVVNVSQIYLPMYITETLQLDKDSIAIVPLIVFASGFLVSLLMKPLNLLCGRKITFVLGQVFVIGACVWIYFIPEKTSWQVYIVSFLLGAGGSTMLVTVLALTADLIKDNVESGAFVYGAMSFTDKLSNGIAVVLIQSFHPCLNCCPACISYYRTVLSVIPGAVTIVAFIVLLTLIPQKIGTRRKMLKLMKNVVADSAVIQRDQSIQSDDSCSETDPLIQKNRKKKLKL